jgi:hypothetical protein
MWDLKLAQSLDIRDVIWMINLFTDGFSMSEIL